MRRVAHHGKPSSPPGPRQRIMRKIGLEQELGAVAAGISWIITC